jgi:CspA family cold shock protein
VVRAIHVHAGTFFRGPHLALQGAVGMSGYSGKVLWFNATKGFGFIAYEHGEVFFHQSSIVQIDGHRLLVEGDLVHFNVIQGPKGTRADMVIKTGESKR